jgi:hypothetical protein
MKRILFTLLIFVFAQNVFGQGINFQGVARSANGTIIASSNISLRLSIISKNVDATPEYIETKTVVTNAQGIFSIVVGDATNAGVTGNFKNIAWKDGIKFLKVEMDPAAGTNYINMGATQLQYVPYSFYSLGVAAENVTGVLPIEKGGTGVGSLADLKTALKISTIDTSSLSNRIDTKASLASPVFSGAITASGFKIPNGTSAQYLRADGTVTTSVTAGVPYTGASQATDLGAYDLSVNGLTIGIGSGTPTVTSNTAVGLNVLKNNLEGTQNTAMGYKALNLNNGTGVTILSSGLSWNNSTGNTAIGSQALYNNTTGSYNTALGNNTLYANTTAVNNVAIGAGVLNFVTTGGNNTGIGAYALENNLSSFNLAIGSHSLRKNTNGYDNTAIGAYALTENLVNNANTAVGASALKNILSSSNTAIGAYAMLGSSIPANNTGDLNTAIGTYALTNNSSGIRNTAIGNTSLVSNSTGSYNTAIGKSALYYNTTGSSNTSFGHRALLNNTTGTDNVAIGDEALYSNVANNSSIAIGRKAMYYANNTSTGVSTYNTAIGYESLMGSSTAANNTGQYNTALGYQSLTSNTTGSSNTAIGYSAMSSSSTYSNSTALGYNAQVTASNQIQLGDANITDVKTSGVITTRGLGIGTKSNTSAALEVNSSSQGFLPPRMTAAQRDNISTPVAGLVVWCTNCADFGELQVYNGSVWTNMIGGAVSLVPDLSSSPPPILVVEASIVFSINIDPGAGNILAVIDATQAMVINISSAIPKDGVNLNVVVKKDSDNSTIFSSAISSISSVNNITISGLSSGVLYTVSVTVTSKSTSSNTTTKTFKLARK